MIRAALAVALLVAVYRGWRLALVASLAWIAIVLERHRRELFARQEDAALQRLAAYWKRLGGGGEQ